MLYMTVLTAFPLAYIIQIVISSSFPTSKQLQTGSALVIYGLGLVIGYLAAILVAVTPTRVT